MATVIGSYWPDTNYVGLDTFTYKVNDGVDDSNVATVQLVVVNAAPVANDDSFYITTDTTNLGVGSVLLNDTDDDGDSLTAVLNTPPSVGTLELDSFGYFEYTPPTGFIGSTSFTYFANDGMTNSFPREVHCSAMTMPTTLKSSWIITAM